jgi:hypothetical protein
MGISLDPQTAATAVGVILLIIGALTAGPSTFAAVGQWLQEDGDVITEPSGTEDPLEWSQLAAPPGFVKHVNLVLGACKTTTTAEVKLRYLQAGLSGAQVSAMETSE